MLNNMESNSLNVSPEEMNYLAAYVFSQLIDDTIRGQCLEFHRAIKLGFFFLDESKGKEDEKSYEIVDGVGLDVFGQVPKSKQFDCVCPHCQRNLAASRFAPHLATCMGIGRTSSRLAHKRITNTGKIESDNDDYDNDSDWNYNSDRKTNKRKRDKNNPRRLSRARAKNEQKKSFLDQFCGAVSEHTKKVCTRSLRCPQHSDNKRKYVRDFALGRMCISDLAEEVQVDVDTVDDDDHSLRSWDMSGSLNPSPNSTSSCSGTSLASKKKDKKASTYSARTSHTDRPPKKNKARIAHAISDNSMHHFSNSDLV